MKRIALSLSSLLLFSSAALADQYQFTGYGPDLASLQKLKNCLDYSTCKFVSSSVAGSEEEYRFHSFVSLSKKEMKSVLNSCQLDRLGFRVTVMNLDLKQPVSDFQSNQTSPRPENRPVELPTMDESISSQLEGEFEKLVQDEQYQETIRLLLDSYRISIGAYRVQFSKSVSPNVCTTDHATHQIKIGMGWFSDVCSLFRGLRHEAEHVRQVEHLTKCNGLSTFADHTMRERSAYLNDVLNIRKFCRDPELARHHESNALSNFFSQYTKH